MTGAQSAAGSMGGADKTIAAIEAVVRALFPLESEDRHKVLQAALVILGESHLNLQKPRTERAESSEIGGVDLSPRARIWIKQTGLEFELLQHVFDISDGIATVIASGVSGKTNAEKTKKCYLLAGVAGFLTSGDPVFSDKNARSICESLGCYDSTNHSKYMKDMGNTIVGSKDKGWKLTAPGLKVAADIVRELAEL